MPPVAWAEIRTAGTVGAATGFWVVTAAGDGGDEGVLDDGVGVGRGEVAGPLVAVPQLESRTMAARTGVIERTDFLMISPLLMLLSSR
jgi:hypothetical protein